MTAPTIVFDLDGTLIDTAPDLLDSLNHCLVSSGLNPAKSSELRQYVGMGGRVMIERAFNAARRQFGKGELDRLLELFLEHYASNMPGQSRPFDGVIEAMDALERDGATFAVCTNKYEHLSVRLIESLKLQHRFKAVCGADTFAWRKPDPRHLLKTIAKAGGVPERAVMIGDSRTDIDTAKAADIPVVAVDFGYSDTHVSAFSPSVVISHFSELTPELIARMLDRQ